MRQYSDWEERRGAEWPMRRRKEGRKEGTKEKGDERVEVYDKGRQREGYEGGIRKRGSCKNEMMTRRKEFEASS